MPIASQIQKTSISDEPVASTSTLAPKQTANPTIPLITAEDSRKFAALLRENIRFASSQGMPTLLADCHRRFVAAWHAPVSDSLKKRKNRLPVTALIHALVKRHERDMRGDRPTTASTLALAFLLNQSSVGDPFLDWPLLNKKTVRGVVSVLSEADWSAIADLQSPAQWPAIFRPRHLADKLRRKLETLPFLLALWIFCARYQLTSPRSEQTIPSYIDVDLFSSLQRNAHKIAMYPDRIRQSISNFYHLLYLYPLQLLNETRISHLARISTSYRPWTTRLDALLADIPFLKHHLVNSDNPRRYLHSLITYALLSPKIEHSHVVLMVEAAAELGYHPDSDLCELLLGHCHDLNLATSAALAYGFPVQHSLRTAPLRCEWPQTLPITDSALAAFLHYLVRSNRLSSALQIVYTLLPGVHLRYYSKYTEYPALEKGQTLYTAMLHVAVSAGSISLAQKIWDAANSLQALHLSRWQDAHIKAKLKARRLGVMPSNMSNDLKSPRYYMIPSSAYVSMLMACLVEAGKAHKYPKREIVAWNSGRQFHNTRGRQLAVTQDVLPLEAIRGLGWNVYRQQMARSKSGSNPRQRPEISFNFCALLLSLCDPGLKRFNSLRAVLHIEPCGMQTHVLQRMRIVGMFDVAS